MKLKEKLAKEHADETGDATDAQSFLAGFEKAREMAVFVANGVHTETNWKVRHDILNLGEEEAG